MAQLTALRLRMKVASIEKDAQSGVVEAYERKVADLTSKLQVQYLYVER